MSTKRKFSEEDGGVHPSRKAHIQTPKSMASKKPRKFEPQPKMHKTQAHASSVNLVKKKIRDVTRRLERSENLPADVKADDERALAAYKQELADAEDEKVRQKMIKKYHMVRFFERQKATRLIKKLRKALITATDEDEVSKLTKKLHIADVDQHYTQYSPLNEIYVSIYRQNGSDDEHKEETKRPEMWYEVERRMEEGGLDQLRNGVRMHIVSRPKPRISGANGEARATQKSTGQQSEPSRASKDGRTETSSLPKRLSRKMTDEEFFKLNRREKRKELKKSGGLVPKAMPTVAASGATIEDAGDISDGGFFDE